MNKRLLSMFLALCMIVTMLPVSAMAEEIHTTIGGNGEIISFAPLTETEKTVSPGKSSEDLELPETLSATVRTAVPADENPVQDSGSPETATLTTATEPEWEETTADVPVRWVSPDYDMNAEGVYVFTPVVEGYTVSAPLPEIVVTVGEMPPLAAARGSVAPMSTTNYGIWVGGVQVTSENANSITGTGIDGTVSYDPTNNTLTLNTATINSAHDAVWIDSVTQGKYGIYATEDLNINMVGDSTILGQNYTNNVSLGIYTGGDLVIKGNGSLNVSGGTGKVSSGIYSSYGNITIEGGEITATSAAADNISVAIVSINGVTISDGVVTATGSAAGIIGAVTITGGDVTVKSDTQALNGSLTTSGYTNCTVTASTNKSGDGADTYNATNLATYKYIKVEPAAGVSEQFSLTPGGTYYFDLSGEKSNVGTVNTALPDTTLHYVPFTYAGTVNAYSLASAMAITQEQANASKSDRSLFVGDYNMGISISWNSLNTANLIFGKTFDTNYTLRSLSVGSSKIGSASGGSDNIGQPNTNEWDQILTKSGSTNNATGWIKNWNSMLSWGQDTSAASRAYRGGLVQQWDHISSSSVYPNLGFRPALEVLNPGTLGPDGLKAVTLNLNGGTLKGSTANINIICAGDNFTAPSGEGLTAPTGKVFDGWKDTSDTTYAVGATVPTTVTGLTAQWEGLDTDVAQIGSTGYPTLQAAVDAVTEGQTIKLLNNITLENYVNIAGGRPSFTLDLNGKTLGYGGDNPTIRHSGSGTLTITDTASGGGGTVSTSGDNSNAIYNASTGNVTVSGGTIESTEGIAINNIDSGTISIPSGSAIIKGGVMAMNTPPDLSGYDKVKITASTTATDGSATSEITKTDIDTVTKVQAYKYLKFEPDTTSPAITSVYTTTTNGTYTMGDTLSFTVIFNENVIVTGEPSLSLTIGSQAKQAAYISGSGTSALLFSYTVQVGDSDSNGISIGSLILNGGTIQDGAGNNANLTLNSVGNMTGVLVDTSEAPSITSQPSPQTVNEGQSATFSVMATGTGLTYRWQINTGSGFSNISNGGVYSGATTATLTITGITAGMNGYLYRAVVTGTYLPAVTSNSVLLKVNAAPTYTITANPASKDFGSLAVGYSAPAAQIVTITNTGNSSVTLTQPTSTNYTIGTLSDTTLAANGTATFTITPKAGLAVGNYNETLTVSTDHSTNATLSLSFSVTAVPTYTITANPTSKNFGSLSVGYSIPAAQTVTITNTGNSSVTLTQPSSTNYTIGTLSDTTLAANGTATFTVTPKAGLAVGNYNETLTVSTDHSTSATVELSFEVTAVPTYTITVNPTSKNFGSLTVGYTAPAAQTVTITNTGNSSVTLTQPTSTNYTIGTLSDTTLAAGGTATFTVTPKAGLAVGAHNETLTVSTDHGTNATVELNFSATAAPTYIVTFNPNGGTVSETSRSVAPGTAVGALPTPTRSGSYIFNGWHTAASGGTQISASTTVDANVTYYAHWTYTGGGGSGSGGGSSSNDNSSPVIVTPPAPDKPNSPTQGEIKVHGTADGNGNITVNITDKAVTDAFDKALADAKKNGNEQNGITVVLHVDAGSKTGSNVTVNLPKTVQDTIIEKKIVNTIVVVDNPDIRIGMDLTTVQEINKQAKSDVNITATRGESSKLTGEAKKAIGSRPVFDLKVNYGSGKQVQNFGTGSVSVTIPYTLGANEKAGNVQAVYVDAKGKVHWLTNSVYDSVEQVLRFSTDHFSTYGIGYKQTNTAFTDIAAHRAKEDIEFVVVRGLFSGTSNTTFSPNTAMTRGMFVTALGRLANADVSGYTKSSFSDVKDDAYYMGYIEWASKNGIVNGVGGGKFAPDQSITREQMAVIMSNYAKTIGYTLPKVHVENIFADNGKISTYAKEAVKQMQMAGVISGKNGNLFDPQGTATRAEVSAVLRRFVELAISSDTAQGWSMNDSGKWMYFKDGKLLTGKQDIDGSTYTFDQYGVTADVPKNLRYTTYTVQKGDSFWSISHKLNCTMAELERLNNKSRFALIHPGDVLRVPEK